MDSRVSKLLSYLKPRTIYTKHSKINGDISVVEQFGRRELVVGNYQQSGWLVAKIWRTGLSAIQNYQLPVTNVLILGLGGGSVVEVIDEYYPDIPITAIEIDPDMVRVGKKYFRLSEHSRLTVKIADAFDFVTSLGNTRVRLREKQKFDLVIIDLYVGEHIPEKLRSDSFLKTIKTCLSDEGVILINHLREDKHKPKAVRFETKLRSVFSQVTSVKPLVNQVFICRL